MPVKGEAGWPRLWDHHHAVALDKPQANHPGDHVGMGRGDALSSCCATATKLPFGVW